MQPPKVKRRALGYAANFANRQILENRESGRGIYDIVNFNEFLPFLSGRISANDRRADSVENHFH